MFAGPRRSGQRSHRHDRSRPGAKPPAFATLADAGIVSNLSPRGRTSRASVAFVANPLNDEFLLP
jgi:hypothetical protein